MNKIIAILTITFIIVSCSEKKVVSMDFSATPKNEKELIARVNSKEQFQEKLSYSKIEFDKEQSTPFKVPESYDEIK